MKSINFRRRRVNGFTLVELLVVLGVLAILVALLFPSLRNMMQASKSGSCIAHLHSIGGAVALYTQDNNGTFPYGSDTVGSYPPDGHGKTYNELLIPYLDSNVLPRTREGEVLHHKIFDCPAVTKPGLGYPFYGFYNFNADVLTIKIVSWQTARRAVELASPSKTFLLSCSTPLGGDPVGWNSLTAANWGKTREETRAFGYYHPREACNFLMADGHVETHFFKDGVPGFSARNVTTGEPITPGSGPCYLY